MKTIHPSNPNDPDVVAYRQHAVACMVSLNVPPMRREVFCRLRKQALNGAAPVLHLVRDDEGRRLAVNLNDGHTTVYLPS